MLRHAVIALFSLVLLSACATTQTGNGNYIDSASYGSIAVDPSFTNVWSWTGTEYGRTDVMTKQSMHRVTKSAFVRPDAEKHADEVVVLEKVEQRASKTIFVPGDSKNHVKLGADEYSYNVYVVESKDIAEFDKSLEEIQAKGFGVSDKYVLIAASRLLNTSRVLRLNYYMDLGLIPDDKRASNEQAIQYVLDRFKMAVRTGE